MKPLEISPDFLQHLTQYQLAIRGYIRGSIKNHFDADDVFQKTNVILCKKSDHWNQDEIPFLKWAFTVARYEVLGYYRDQSRDKHIFNDDVLELILDDSKKLAPELSKRAEFLKLCLENVSKENRFILACKYGADQGIAQIAQQVDRSADGVKSLLKRVRHKIRICITNKMEASSL